MRRKLSEECRYPSSCCGESNRGTATRGSASLARRARSRGASRAVARLACRQSRSPARPARNPRIRFASPRTSLLVCNGRPARQVRGPAVTVIYWENSRILTGWADIYPRLPRRGRRAMARWWDSSAFLQPARSRSRLPPSSLSGVAALAPRWTPALPPRRPTWRRTSPHPSRLARARRRSPPMFLPSRRSGRAHRCRSRSTSSVPPSRCSSTNPTAWSWGTRHAGVASRVGTSCVKR